MKRFLRSQPIETYVLLLLPCLVLITAVFYSGTNAGFGIATTLKVMLMSFLLGGDYLAVAFVLLYIYLFARLIYRLVNRKNAARGTLLIGVRSWMYLSLMIGAATAITAIIVGSLSVVPHAHIISASEKLMALDKMLFGVYPPFWLHQIQLPPFVDTLLVYAYRAIGVFMALVLLALAGGHRTLFRQYLLAFFMATLLAMPFWKLLPAIAPNEMYRQNILQSEISEQLQVDTAIKEKLTPSFTQYLTKLEQTNIDPEREVFSTSTFPSMHVAWGVLIAYFGTLLWWPLGIVLIPWALANAVSTMYVLEHYGIDAIGGILLAVLAIIISRLLLAVEQKYHSSSWQPFYIIDILCEDMTILKKHLGSALSVKGFMDLS